MTYRTVGAPFAQNGRYWVTTYDRDRKTHKVTCAVNHDFATMEEAQEFCRKTRIAIQREAVLLENMP